MTFTLVAERLTPVHMTWFCRGWDSNIKSSACDANALTASDEGMMIIKYFYIMKTCKIPSELCDIGFFRMTNIISHVSWHPWVNTSQDIKCTINMISNCAEEDNLAQIELYLRFLLCFSRLL